MMKYTATLAALVASAYAQSSDMASMAASVSVSAVASVVPGSSLSASANTGIFPSAAQSASPSGLPVTTNTSYGFVCPAGFSLTYGITNATYTGVDLMTAVMFFSNWTGAAPGMVSESQGTNMTGDTRTYMPDGMDFEISEVLANSTIDEETGALHQTWNTTEAYELMGVQVASAFSDFQIYANESTGATTVQYFTNLCTNSQDAVVAALPAILSGATNFWAEQLTTEVMSGSMSMSMSMPASQSGAGGIIAGATSSAGAGVASITSAPGGILSSVTGGAAGVISSVTGLPASLAGNIPSVPTPTLRARGRWL